MNVPEVVAVISGDLVKSKRLEDRRQTVLDQVTSAIALTQERLLQKNSRLVSSGFFRGDAFQYALPHPQHALWTVVHLKAELLKLRNNNVFVDSRIGIGLGSASAWNEQDISASDGEAFQLSGKALDSLKSGKEKYRRLRILTPWPESDLVYSILASFLDAVSQRWTAEQAEAMSLFLDNKTQDEISKELKIKQPAVQMRLQTAGHYAVKEALEYFEDKVEGIIKHGPYNRGL